MTKLSKQLNNNVKNGECCITVICVRKKKNLGTTEVKAVEGCMPHEKHKANTKSHKKTPEIPHFQSPEKKAFLLYICHDVGLTSFSPLMFFKKS